MRHHRGAQDPDADVQHLPIAQDLRRWYQEAVGYGGELRSREKYFQPEADSDYSDQCDDQRLDVSETAVLQVKNEKYIQRRDADADKQRNVKQQLQSNGRADDFRQIA